MYRSHYYSNFRVTRQPRNQISFLSQRPLAASLQTHFLPEVYFKRFFCHKMSRLKPLNGLQKENIHFSFHHKQSRLSVMLSMCLNSIFCIFCTKLCFKSLPDKGYFKKASLVSNIDKRNSAFFSKRNGKKLFLLKIFVFITSRDTWSQKKTCRSRVKHFYYNFRFTKPWKKFLIVA